MTSQSSSPAPASTQAVGSLPAPTLSLPTTGQAPPPSQLAITCQSAAATQGGQQATLIQGGFTFLGAVLGAAVAIITTRLVLKGHEGREAAQRAEARKVTRDTLTRQKIEEYLGLIESEVQAVMGSFSEIRRFGIAFKHVAASQKPAGVQEAGQPSDALNRASVIEEVYFPEAQGVVAELRKAKIDAMDVVTAGIAQLQVKEDRWFDECSSAFEQQTNACIQTMALIQARAVAAAQTALKRT